MPVYRATADGTLSNPYRHVRKGDLVVLKEPIKASWLEPTDPAEKKSEPEKRAETPLLGPRKINDEGYDKSMAPILAREKIEDELARKKQAALTALGAADPGPDALAALAKLAETVQEPQAGGAGTGNQDVI